MTVGMLAGEFYLIDNWPGVPTNGPNPSSWVVASATEDYPIGTKRLIYDDTNKGWATLMFLQYLDGTVAEPGHAAGKFPICGMVQAQASAGNYYVVNNDCDEIDKGGPIAICLATNLSVNTLPYAWFWVGGVCPVDTIATLDDFAYVAADGVTSQSHMKLASSAGSAAFVVGTASHIGNFSAYSLVVNATA